MGTAAAELQIYYQTIEMCPWFYFEIMLDLESIIDKPIKHLLGLIFPSDTTRARSTNDECANTLIGREEIRTMQPYQIKREPRISASVAAGIDTPLNIMYMWAMQKRYSGDILPKEGVFTTYERGWLRDFNRNTSHHQICEPSIFN
ncbi:5559ccdf-50e6-41ff-a9ac-156549d23f12 [Sclerotinia trifoliorum]|uniref:5559ccdf-50e6-41ff-a9ac-156549d23f12 n=1 Tax=Sclerotinia trifoliorum TaxID=28548 RepID=A0A8H2ZNR2_9HELO|nr:5559ccdf-50e6-41ff-a9ac-156549d23f12 [Sclerotinia trifoliorum]